MSTEVCGPYKHIPFNERDLQTFIEGNDKNWIIYAHSQTPTRLTFGGRVKIY